MEAVRFASEKTVPFSPEHLRQLVKNASQSDLSLNERMKPIRDYLETYFALYEDKKIVLYWKPDKKTFEFVNDDEFKARMVNDTMAVKIKYEGQKKEYEYLVSTDFLKKNDKRALLHSDVKKPRVYLDQYGRMIANTFQGYMHTEPKKYSNYSPEIKKGVDMVWSHVKNVLCGGNEIDFNYTRNWIVKLCKGNKMMTSLVMLSGQGEGKNTLTDFLRRFVLGNDVCQSVTDCRPFIDKFNHILMGKVFVVAEELDCTPSEWHKLHSKFKLIINSPTYTFEQKNKDQVQCENIMSLMILSNKSHALKLESDDRRFFLLDVSAIKKQDHVYWDLIYSYINNPLVGEAFYWFCQEFDLQEWREYPLPQRLTKRKQDLILESLPTFYHFIKEKYVLKKTDLKCRLKFLAKEFEEYCKDKNIKQTIKPTTSSHTIGRLLREIGVETVKRAHNETYAVCDHPKLLKIYTEKQWISDTDEFINDEDEDVDIDTLIEEKKPQSFVDKYHKFLEFLKTNYLLVGKDISCKMMDLLNEYGDININIKIALIEIFGESCIRDQAVYVNFDDLFNVFCTHNLITIFEACSIDWFSASCSSIKRILSEVNNQPRGQAEKGDLLLLPKERVNNVKKAEKPKNELTNSKKAPKRKEVKKMMYKPLPTHEVGDQFANDFYDFDD